MTDISKVTGQDNFGRKDSKSSSADADKFKSAMRRRVDEVSQVDPDEQKKRKRREEVEQEAASRETAAPPPEPRVPSEATPFPSVKVNIGKRTLTSSSGVEGPSASPSPAASETGAVFSEEPPSTPSVSQGQTPSFSQERQTEEEPTQRTETQPNSQSQQAHQKERDREKKTAETAPIAVPLEAPLKKEDAAALFAQERKKVAPVKKAASVVPEEGAVVAPQPPPTPIAEPATVKKEETPQVAGIDATGAQGNLLAMPTPIQPTALPSYTRMTPLVAQLFDRMVGVMTVMNASGIAETVVTLNSPQFASSVFFGAQIIIKKEFSTAPKEFNIQFNGTPQAVALFQGNAQDLMAAFQQGNWGFRVHRLDTGNIEDKPLFKRKEKISGDGQNQTGTGP